MAGTRAHWRVGVVPGRSPRVSRGFGAIFMADNVLGICQSRVRVALSRWRYHHNYKFYLGKLRCPYHLAVMRGCWRGGQHWCARSEPWTLN